MRAAPVLLALTVLGTSLSATGCAEFDAFFAATAPKVGNHQGAAVKVASVKLAHAPTEKQLASHFCSKLSHKELGDFGFVGDMGCEAVFGPLPPRKDLQFAFDVDLVAANPSPIPLPLVSVLVAFTAFPDRRPMGGKQALGAVCLTLCKDPHNCAQKADSCSSRQPEVHDLASFEAASANFLMSVALGEKSFSDLKIQTIPPKKSIHFNTRFALDIDEMAKLLGTVAEDAIAAVKKKKNPHFVIPYALQGSAWINIESFGRIGTSIPITKGVWDLAKL
jgi:hypothetical protein